MTRCANAARMLIAAVGSIDCLNFGIQSFADVDRTFLPRLMLKSNDWPIADLKSARSSPNGSTRSYAIHSVSSALVMVASRSRTVLPSASARRKQKRRSNWVSNFLLLPPRLLLRRSCSSQEFSSRAYRALWRFWLAIYPLGPA